jgi:UDP-N-acetylglucosamine--N-acetylmuramyl-(pentapeptide) pyrophosphoryl-undecaprenol N-acetylglucosamine transferase
MGVPTLIHEQNAVMGRANRMLASRVEAIAGGFLSDREGPHASRTVTTGNPVRPAVLEAARQDYVPSRAGEPFRLVVFGGSQGASFFSQALPQAIDQLPDELRLRLRVTQQARREDMTAVEAYYRGKGIDCEVSPFFSDMAARMAAAHLVISRSGASTVSEISVIGRPAILVPYPHALDHDQAANAAALMAKGGAEVVRQEELSPEALAGRIAAAMLEPDRLALTAERAKAAGSPDATALLASMVEAIADGMSVREFKEKRI